MERQVLTEENEKSGRHDLNVRLPAPKAGALAKLSYAPICLMAVVVDFINRRRTTRHTQSLLVRDAVSRAEFSGGDLMMPEFLTEVLAGSGQRV